MNEDEDLSALARIDTTTAHPARRYNYWLGGKDNFAADRESGDAIAAVMPNIRTAALENRRFLGRTARFLAEQGVRQFLDIGTGIPAADNTHEVVQGVDPTSRVVYVDNDPIVLVHARALLTSTPQGKTAYIDADLRDPEKILDHPDLHATLDLTQPVGLMLVAILHFIRDDEDPAGVIAKLVDVLPAGSYVVVSHATWDFVSPEAVARLQASNRDGRFQARTRQQFAALLDGLELVEPGIVSVSEWRAADEPQPRPSVEDVAFYGAVARI